MRMNSRSKLITLAALTLAVFGATAQAQDIEAPEEFAEVRSAIKNAVFLGLAPSVAVAVVQEGELVWAEGFGMADIKQNRKATANSIYRLASISKPITATGLMMLVEDGRIELDAPANNYLGDAKLRAPLGSADDMTIRRLANHTSGLPIHYNFYYNDVQPLRMDEAIRRYGFAATKPGEERVYSNLGFGILNYITERVSGTPWKQHMRDKVYDPLGLSRMGHGIPANHKDDAVVQYDRDSAGRYYAVPHYEFDHPGGSVICSSARDLARFAMLHINEGELDGVRLLKPETVKAMQKPTTHQRNSNGTGVAWFVDTERGRRVISHTGGMPGVSTSLRIFPDERAAIVVLTNTSSRTVARQIPGRISQTLFPEVKPVPFEREADALAVATSQDPPKPLTGQWTGQIVHHAGDIPVTVDVEEAGRVRVRLGDTAPQTLSGRLASNYRLAGSVQVRLRLQEGFHGPCRLQLDLTRRGDRLTGAAVAFADGYFALSHWVELELKPDEES